MYTARTEWLRKKTDKEESGTGSATLRKDDDI